MWVWRSCVEGQQIYLLKNFPALTFALQIWIIWPGCSRAVKQKTWKKIFILKITAMLFSKTWATTFLFLAAQLPAAAKRLNGKMATNTHWSNWKFQTRVILFTQVKMCVWIPPAVLINSTNVTVKRHNLYLCNYITPWFKQPGSFCFPTGCI